MGAEEEEEEEEEEIPDRTPAYARSYAKERITKLCIVCNRAFVVAPQCQGQYSTCAQACANARRKGYSALHRRNKP